MCRHSRRIVEQVVGVRQDGGARPMLAVVAGGVVLPDRAERRLEGAFAASREEPDPPIAIAGDAGDVVVGGGSGLSFLAGLARGLRFGTAHGEVPRSAPGPRSRQGRGHGFGGLEPLATRQDAHANLSSLHIKWNPLIAHERSKVLAPRRTAALPGYPEP